MAYLTTTHECKTGNHAKCAGSQTARDVEGNIAFGGWNCQCSCHHAEVSEALVRPVSVPDSAVRDLIAKWRGTAEDFKQCSERSKKSSPGDANRLKIKAEVYARAADELEALL